MRKLRVGVWINDDFDPTIGGGFGYYGQLIKCLDTGNFGETQIVFLSQNPLVKSESFTKPLYHIKTQKPRKLNVVQRKFNSLLIKLKLKNPRINYDSNLKTELKKVVDLIYYAYPGVEVKEFPNILTIWDLGHLISYPFPELALHKNFEYRKKFYDFEPNMALSIICESEQGKKDVLNYLPINEGKIKIIPLLPSEIIEKKVLAKKPKNIDTDCFFIHYPAQFWSHKNHYNLVKAFKTVAAEYPNLKLFFTGSDKGNKEYINDVISELNLTDNIINLGFIELEELKWLYLNSQGLVMPTFLGPTNMPLLEAAILGCPVACSNLPGHQEQLGEYGYYFSPDNQSEISNSILEMLKSNLSGNKKTFKQYNDPIQTTITKLNNIFTEVTNIRFCWGENDVIL